MNFGHPDGLWALWLCPAGILLLAVLYRMRMRGVQRWLSPEALARLAPDWRPARRRARLALWSLAMTSLLVAWARPQWGFRWEQTTQRGLDLLIALDTSRSMLAADFKPNRLTQAKWALLDFSRKLRGDRIGLIPFAGTAFLQCPLTVDYAAFALSLEDVQIGLVPRGGTAIASALRVAVETFEKQAESDRVLLLLTDGEDHAGQIERWLPELKAKGIKVYAIGIGSPEGEPLPAADGSAGFQKDAAGNVIVSRLSEEPLRRLAQETGGTYVRATPGDLGLDLIRERELSKLNRSESDARLAKVNEEQAGWFIALALMLLVAESLVADRTWRSTE